MIKDFIQTVACTTAQEFVEAILPTSHYFHGDLPYSWLYRGHTRADYELIPSALRSRNSLSKVAIVLCNTNESQIENELKILKNFFEISDLKGLSLPEDSQILRNFINELSGYIGFQSLLENTKKNPMAWPPKELLSLAGLAQHYGLPTRLLDWTYDPLIAAYFAAKGVVQASHDASAQRDLIKKYCFHSGTKYSKQASTIAILGLERRLSVWAFSKSVDIAFQHALDAKPLYEIVTVPYAENPNIATQQGLFTVVRSTYIPAGVIDRRPFDKMLAERAEQMKLPPDKCALFTQFTLPWEQAFELLRLLAKLRTNASTIFPGFKGASDTVAEKLWWWRSEEKNALLDADPNVS